MAGRHVLKLMTLLVAVVFYAPAALAAYPAAKATTRGVVIYPDRAMVKKSLPVSVVKGENTLEVTGLTPSVIDDSVQAGLRQGGGVRIVDIEVRRTALVKPEQDRVSQLQAQIDKLDQELARMGQTLEVNKNSIAFLQKIVPFSQQQNTSFQTVRDYLGGMEQTMADRLAKVAELEQGMTELKKRKAELERELRNLGPGRDDSKSLLVTLYADAPASVNLEYSYLVDSISWTPKYEVRADSLTQKLELNFFALIRQATGEDLSGSGIEISTARPAVSGELPELAPWRLDLYVPPVAYRSKSLAPLEMRTDMALMEMAAAAPAPVPEMMEPEVRTEATSMSYVLRQRVSLPSDNQPHKILVSSTGGEGTFEYLAVPKLARFAALTAALKNPFAFPLLEGEMNVFLDGRFVSTSQIHEPVLAGDEIRLPLGLDETIVVNDTLRKQFTEGSGAFSSQIRKHFEYEIELINSKALPIELVVRDHVPVSAHEKIRVEIQAPTKEAELSDEGIVTWKVSLKPGEKRLLNTRFEVTYPAKERVTGL